MIREFSDAIDRTPEDAARHYDMASLDGWVDEPDHGDGWGAISFMLGVLAFMAVAFCAGVIIAVEWSTYDDVPARGVMDHIR